MTAAAALQRGVTSSPKVSSLVFVGSGMLAAASTGLAVAGGYSLYLIGAAALIFAVLRPQLALFALVGGLLISGRTLSHIQVASNLYITDVFLAALVAGAAVQVMRGSIAPSTGVKAALTLNAALWLPALGAVLFRTTGNPNAWLPNFALIYYALFAFVAAAQCPTIKLFRHLFVVVLAASCVAFVLVMTGHGGGDQGIGTSTAGLTKLAHSSYAFPFGIAPLVLIVAVRHRLLRPYWLAGTAPFLLALLLLNHRSAWLAFAIGLLAILATRITFPLAATLALVLAVAAIVVRQEVNRHSTVRLEIRRAQSVTSETDPNNRYRLQFWKGLTVASVHSPFIGLGFDPYPTNFVPGGTNLGTRSDPHNSFVALAYRVGLFPVSILLAICGVIIGKGVRLSIRAEEPHSRAIASALTAIVVYVGVMSAFNVFLELPYAAPLFWISLGLLMTLVKAGPRPGPFR